MQIKTIIFDLDDTLIDNTYRYHEAFWRCGLIICKALGGKSPHPKEVLDKQRELDNELLTEFGYRVERYPTAMVRTYEWFCEENGLRPSEDVKRNLFNVASRFKYGPFALKPGVMSMLRTFKKEGYVLHLVTLGDFGLQSRKIIQAGLGRRTTTGKWKSSIFDQIHIPARDKKATLAEIAEGEPQTCMMVGDSTGSDIKPASDLGMVAVWIPSQTYFNEASVKKSLFHTRSSVLELPDFLSKFRLRRCKANGKSKNTGKKTRKGRTSRKAAGKRPAKRAAKPVRKHKKKAKRPVRGSKPRKR